MPPAAPSHITSYLIVTIFQPFCHSTADIDARPQGPLGSPAAAAYTAGARSSFVDDSPLMTSGGFESPPPSVSVAWPSWYGTGCHEEKLLFGGR